MSSRRGQRIPCSVLALAVVALVAALHPGIAAAQEAVPAADPAAAAAIPPDAAAAPASTTTAPADSATPATAAAAPADAAAGPAGGTQGPTSSFAGLSKNSDEPIDIESDLLYVYDAKKLATFKGNVVAVQGTTILHSKELDVHYVGSGSDSLTGAKKEAGEAEKTSDQGAGASDSGTKISKIYARGDVVIDSDEDQTTTSDWALYDLPSQLVTVGGNVVLTQGKNVLKGDRLIIDLTTGESRFENTGSAGTGKRIRALFMPKEEGGSNDADSDDDQSGKKRKKPKADDSASSQEASGQAAAGQGAAAQDETLPWQILPGGQQ